MKKKTFEYEFACRSAVCLFLIFLLFLFAVMRLMSIATGQYSQAAANQGRYKIPLGYIRGTIFDCNMVPLTNNQSYIVAAVSPVPSAVTAVKGNLSGTLSDEEMSDLALGKPTVCEVKKRLSADGMVCATLYRNNTKNTPAMHLLGYTDSTGHGVSGLQKAYDELLYFKDTPYAVFSVNAKGKTFAGVNPQFENINSPHQNAVVSTIDINIQNIAQNAAIDIKNGAVLVAEAASGKVRAAVSMPLFDLENVKDSINEKNSPFLDKTISAYSVGSVFKPCVAVAAFKQEKQGFLYHCTGSEFIVDRKFGCHKREGHAELDLCGALANSCNTYFYSFGEEIGAQSIYKVAQSFNFGSGFKIADNLFCAGGSLPEISSLENKAQLANFSIGQGKLSLSPMALLNLYSAIANGGQYCLPSVVEGTVQDGEFEKYKIAAPTRVMSKGVADALLEYLSFVISEGTGTEAAPKTVTAAGKTATAQTGRYDENGIEITNSWFCGMFPRENPKYVVVVMSEGKSDVSTAEVFAKIADGIWELKI